MSFSADWLTLREPVDVAARNRNLLSQAARVAGKNATIVDLGSGTGSTARAFEGPLPATWTWRFVDSDTELLKIAQARHPGSDFVRMNLRDIDDLPLDGVSLVTASALLDLMPEDWINRLAKRLKAAAIPFYAALNYNGQMHWSPHLDADAAITTAFNLHQQTDKGIGPAMGPNSGQLATQILIDHGFDVTTSDSPWLIGPDHIELHQQLIAGIGAAAHDVNQQLASDWVRDRNESIAHSKATIGHTDFLAMPRRA